MTGNLVPEVLYQQMVELRRDLHRHPELAFQEKETAKIIMAELDRLQIPYDYGGVGGAVVARIAGGNGDARTIALRADMDGLPGREATGLPFTSLHENRMHACGHDAHMAIVLGAAALLSASPPEGNVVLIFQPAEERGAGSRKVIASGAIRGVSAIFGGHVTHHYRVGEIMVTEGTISAQSDRFSIRVRGKGGHAARPHETVDAVVITGLLITAMQTLVSRAVDPVHPSVVTIGKVEAGSAPNVIAEEATLEGTIRTTLPDTRKHILERLQHMVSSMGDVYGARIEIQLRPGYPPVVNTARETDIARRAALAVVGEEFVPTQDYPSMGSEDFSFYLKEVPGCYVRFGARLSDGVYIPLHSPSFDLDERVLEVGAAYFDAVAREALAAG